MNTQPLEQPTTIAMVIACCQQDRLTEFKRGELWHSPRYKNAIERFGTHYDLNQFSFKELDKFLWLYNKEVFAA